MMTVKRVIMTVQLQEAARTALCLLGVVNDEVVRASIETAADGLMVVHERHADVLHAAARNRIGNLLARFEDLIRFEPIASPHVTVDGRDVDVLDRLRGIIRNRERMVVRESRKRGGGKYERCRRERREQGLHR